MASKQVSVPKTETGVEIGLDIRERLLMRRMYPQEADLMTQIISRDIDKKVEITQKEAESVGLEQFETELGKSSLKWNENGEKSKKFRFTNPEVELLKAQVKKLDETKKVTPDMVGLLLKIKDLEKK